MTILEKNEKLKKDVMMRLKHIIDDKFNKTVSIDVSKEITEYLKDTKKSKITQYVSTENHKIRESL